MRQILSAAIAAVLLTLLPSLTAAQTLGTVAGAVKDASGALLPGVTVEVTSPALIERTRSATTDGSGLYRIVNLPPGLYTVSFTLEGFNTVRREQVQISAGFTASIDAEMKVGNIQETVTVTGESPVIDVQSAATRRSVTADAFKEILNVRGAHVHEQRYTNFVLGRANLTSLLATGEATGGGAPFKSINAEALRRGMSR